MSKVKIDKKRHIIKAVTWSLLASATTFLVGKAFGLENDKALMIVAIAFSMMQWTVSPMPIGLTPRHLSRAISRQATKAD